jgi:hypothetical protein
MAIKAWPIAETELLPGIRRGAVIPRVHLHGSRYEDCRIVDIVEREDREGHRLYGADELIYVWCLDSGKIRSVSPLTIIHALEGKE